ncbi:hypothetical protein JOL79_26020 [Microbispora sp. RL4-1S]|uniref:Uncharacterized protein n=1 Tax=Microbispora oryzae TaxID=2806554 RepID=A0A941AKI9_9ACTN|nr:hypothetical protein [Microbispora oryzae]MBP2707246.1 hypothetical protein [Microbispora oryzae]
MQTRATVQVQTRATVRATVQTRTSMQVRGAVRGVGAGARLRGAGTGSERGQSPSG